MAADERARYDRAIASRIARHDPDTPWLTLPQAVADLDDLLLDAGLEHVTFLEEHRVHLTQRAARAALALNGNGAEADAPG